jgi:hypothetical protein
VIELAWSQVKTILRRLKARTFPDLLKALKQALLAITPQISKASLFIAVTPSID